MTNKIEGKTGSAGKLKYVLGGLALSVGSLIFMALFLELVLRFFPVSMSLRPEPMNSHNPVRRFEPNRNVTWSRFPDFSMQRNIRINNYGFVSDIDYVSDSTTPLLAVIGDSYIEARQVETSDAIHGKIDSLQDVFRVYSFGSSGTPLSGYVGYAKWIREKLTPEKVIIVVVGNDFDESLAKYRSPSHRKMFDYFDLDESGLLQWFPGNAETSLVQRVLRRSYLVMYLYNNLGLQNIWSNIKGLFKKNGETYVGNTVASITESRLSDSKLAVDAFLKLIPEASGLLGKDILLVVDAPRPEIYNEERTESAAGSYFGVIRQYLIQKARSAGVQAIDLTGPMRLDWNANHLRFEFPHDSHWNARGHEVAARAVLDSGFLATK